MSCSLLTSDLLLSAAAQCIPPMDGQGGCVGVVGGSSSQPGAVSLAVGAALRAGADRVLACCADAEAAAALRCCWPTQPTLVLDVSCHGNNEQRQWLSERFVNAGCQAVLVGPGLDASDRAAQLAAAAIEAAQALNLPLVIDGSALSAVSNNPNLIRGNRRVILTPNWSEFCRLCESAVSTSPPPSEAGASAKEAAVDSARRLVARLSAALGGVCVLLKGREDVVAAGEGPDSQAEVCALQGSARRCTGQGALVAGLALVFSHWCFSSADSRSPAASSASPLLRHPSLLAAYAAAALARRCAVQAFASRRRATVASDSLEQIGPAFCRLFPEADCLH